MQLLKCDINVISQSFIQNSGRQEFEQFLRTLRKPKRPMDCTFRWPQAVLVDVGNSTGVGFALHVHVRRRSGHQTRSCLEHGLALHGIPHVACESSASERMLTSLRTNFGTSGDLSSCLNSTYIHVFTHHCSVQRGMQDMWRASLRVLLHLWQAFKTS